MDRTTRTLFHKTIRVADISFEGNVPVRITQVYNQDHMPVGVNRTIDTFRMWALTRCLPVSRRRDMEALKSLGIKDPLDLTARSHFVSMTDCYWIASMKEIQEGITWQQVDPRSYGLWTKSGQAVFAGRTDLVNDLHSPDFCTNGSTPKTWVDEDDGIYLLKEDRRNGMDAFAEIAAGETASLLGINSIPYFFSVTCGKLCVGSMGIIQDDTVEMIPFTALEKEGIVGDKLFAFAEEYGFLEDVRKMLILDYLIGRPVRAAEDVSILRNPDTLELYGLAPLYGNSEAFRTHGGGEMQDISPLTGRSSLEDYQDSIRKVSLRDFDEADLLSRYGKIASELQLSTDVADPIREIKEKIARIQD